MTAALLPPNATDMERALVDVVGAALTVPVQIETLWNPWTCPVPLLPWLAWAMSVPVWEDDWAEETKRQVIAASFETHRTKGTRAALLRALEPFGLTSEIVEWWEDGGSGQPFTFGLTSWVTSAPATAKVQSNIAQTVAATAPVRAHMTGFRIGAGFAGQTGIAAAGDLVAHAPADGDAVGRQGFDQAMWLATALAGTQSHQQSGSVAGRSFLAGEAVTAAGLDALAFASLASDVTGGRSLAGETQSAQVGASVPTARHDGPATGRRQLDSDIGQAAALACSEFFSCLFSDGETTVAESFFVRKSGCPEAQITMRGRTLVAIIEGKTYRLAGPPIETDVKTVGVCDAVAGTTTVQFSVPPLDLLPGDLLIAGTETLTVQTVVGSTVFVTTNISAPLDGVLAFRLRL